MSADVRNDKESPETLSQVFSFDFGDINLLKKIQSRLYYCYAAQGGFLYMRHVGTLNYDESLYYGTQIAKDESWLNGAKILNDLRWLDSSASNFDTHHRLTKSVAALYKKNGRFFGNVVALCNSDFEFGMRRMFDSLWENDEFELKTVRDLDAAVELLEIDRKLLDRIIAEIDKIESSAN